MRAHILLTIVGIAALVVSCGKSENRPQLPPAERSVHPDMSELRVKTLMRKSCGSRGTLIVQMRETPAEDGKWRNIQYVFLLVQPAGGPPSRELCSISMSTEPTPFGSETMSRVLLDATYTADNQLVSVFFKTRPDGGTGVYIASISSLDGAKQDVPASAFEPELYEPANPREERLRATITGTVAGNDLTVLLGDKDLHLRFRFQLFEGVRIGWYRLPGAIPPNNFIAPPLTATRK